MSVAQPKVRTTISVYAPLLLRFKELARGEGLDVSSALERVMEEVIERGYISRVRGDRE